MNSGIIMIYDDSPEFFESMKDIIEDFSDEHQRIIDMLLDLKIVFEKDNTAIEDILNCCLMTNRVYIKDCDEIVKDIAIGYCIIPIRDYEIP